MSFSPSAMDRPHPPRVVHLRRRKGLVIQNCDVYIGRALNMGGWRLKKSKWANPFSIKEVGSAEEAVRRYREYILSSPSLLNDLGELEGKTLGCWCTPNPCHGDVLVALFKLSHRL